MGFELKDIIDLEFLLDLDEASQGETSQDETGQDGEQVDLAARDRDIFRQIAAQDEASVLSPGVSSDLPSTLSDRLSGRLPNRLSDRLSDDQLVRGWLSYRRLLYCHQTDPPKPLPGDLFDALVKWAGRVLFSGGLILGLMAAVSFLAYHGSRPINVTVFVSVFILLQALVSFMALAVMARQIFGKTTRRQALFQTLISAGLFKRLDRKLEDISDSSGGAALKRFGGFSALLHRVNQSHNGIVFWTFFILSTLVALGVSCGALGGTLFRVAATDLAFGWQSTLLTSGQQVHHLVHWIGLPWSWWLPQALPTLDQIEGSRIVLKEGIAHLSSEDLAAWWPFICMGLLVYGLGFRLLVAGLAVRCRAAALAGVDMGQARFQRLLVRMRSVRMETRVRDWPADRGAVPPMPPRPDTEEWPETDSDQKETDPGETAEGQRVEDGVENGVEDGAEPNLQKALVLMSERACPESELAGLVARVEGQLGVRAAWTLPVTFDLDRDRDRLLPLVQDNPSLTVVFLQEVWQPPIRGQLYYYSQIKSQVFARHRVWVLLIQTPGREDPAVSAGDMNYKVWKTAVSRLDGPEFILERMLP